MQVVRMKDVSDHTFKLSLDDNWLSPPVLIPLYAVPNEAKWILSSRAHFYLYVAPLTMLLDLPHSRHRFRVCDRPYKCSVHRCSISSLPATQIFRDGTCRCGRINGCNISPNHAQQPYQRKSWLRKRCSCECGHDQRSAFHSMSPNANKASTATEGRELHSYSQKLFDRSCLCLCMYMVSGLMLIGINVQVIFFHSSGWLLSKSGFSFNPFISN
jgi:hypothetical protein